MYSAIEETCYVESKSVFCMWVWKEIEMYSILDP